MAEVDTTAARLFIRTNARLLERRVYAALFENGEVGAVVDCLRGFRNADGGFGHGLEPDKLAPGSQPLDVEIAFERLVLVRATEPAMVTAACDWLHTIGDDRGAVPILLPTYAEYPRATHWVQSEYAPDLNPTAALVSHVHSLKVSHPWAERATEYCFSELEHGRVPDEAHALLAVTKFLASAPDRDRANALAPIVSHALSGAAYMKLQPNDQGYGLTPLDFAPTPTSFAAPWFLPENLQGHVNNLAAQQLDDGGWPVEWDPPGEPSRYAWRSIRTLHALSTLEAYSKN